MTVEELNELQQALDQGQPLDAGQCRALLAEVWRLKNLNNAKTMEARVARDESSEATAALNAVRAESAALRTELQNLKDLNGLVVCELESRWTNCAVRKRRAAHGGPIPRSDES